MTCKQCIHYKACKFTYIEAFGSFNEEQFGQTGCAEFEDKSRFVEVVRCKDCMHFTAGYCCRDIKGRSQMHYMGEGSFCSYGERKENERTID